MKIFTSILDIALLPVAIVKDVATAPIKIIAPFDKREILGSTREQAEKIDEDLE